MAVLLVRIQGQTAKLKTTLKRALSGMSGMSGTTHGSQTFGSEMALIGRYPQPALEHGSPGAASLRGVAV